MPLPIISKDKVIEEKEGIAKKIPIISKDKVIEEKEGIAKKIPIIPKEEVAEEKKGIAKRIPPSCPRLAVPARKKPLEVKKVIPTEDKCCTNICQTLNSEIDRFSSIITILNRDIERGCTLPGIEKAITAIAYKMNSLEDYRSLIKKRNICKCIE